ncbi:hypothetical protein ACFQ07_29090 [Actinomadura adrarensis]|uniref:Uncharacterized protein n=1 Tax=Actinomadura adrarensis TaxID=1819600 RepID=A0ABW3CPN2_9ACTN
MNDPDSLADVADRWSDSIHPHAESLGHQFLAVYEERTGVRRRP